MSNDIFDALDNDGDNFGQSGATSNIDNMLGGDQDDDDLFGQDHPPAAAQPAPESSPVGGNLDDMLTNDNDDDDLFGGAPQQSFQQSQDQHHNDQPEASAALQQWEAKKKEEIAQLDQKEEKENEALRDEARDKLEKHLATLRNSQEMRAKQNREADQQKMADLESTVSNKWEKTVAYIDFNRGDLHERDVSRMK